MPAWFSSVDLHLLLPARLLLFFILLPLSTICLVAVILVLRPGDDFKLKGFGIKIEVRRAKSLKWVKYRCKRGVSAQNG